MQVGSILTTVGFIEKIYLPSRCVHQFICLPWISFELFLEILASMRLTLNIFTDKFCMHDL